jgi:uncharacterized protein (UPF0264 family)
MAKLLVSVRSRQEAREALAGGADVIDVKEPSAGPLGAPSVGQMLEIWRVVSGRVPLSAACGELLDVPDCGLSRERQAALRGFGLVKLGLAGCARIDDWRARWTNTARQMLGTAATVAVVYADCEAAQAPDAPDVIDAARNLGCRWLLVDTYHKSGGGLFEYWTDGQLAAAMRLARQAGMSVALAGSLTCELIPRALCFQPDLIAVRGAACRDGRQGTISADRVRRLAERITDRRAIVGTRSEC